MSDTNIKEKPHRYTLIFFVFTLFFLFLIMPSVSFKYMKEALKLCATGLIPSLFPFMVISDILSKSNAGQIIRKFVCTPISLALGTSRDGSFAVLLGLLCGFPIGARVALSLHRDGRISRAELSHVMSFCNIPSPAFVCGTLGVMFGSVGFASLLFASLLISCLIIGISGRFIFKYEKQKTAQSSGADVLEIFAPSVGNACSVMLCVCGYVVFFSVIYGYIRSLCDACGAPDIIPTVCSGLLEISGGMSCLSSYNGAWRVPLAGFFAGFSGLSVFFQIVSLDTDRVISKKEFLLQKLLQGGVCALVFSVLVNAFSVETSVTEQAVGCFYSGFGTYSCLVFFAAAILPILLYSNKNQA